MQGGLFTFKNSWRSFFQEIHILLHPVYVLIESLELSKNSTQGALHLGVNQHARQQHSLSSQRPYSLCSSVPPSYAHMMTNLIQ